MFKKLVAAGAASLLLASAPVMAQSLDLGVDADANAGANGAGAAASMSAGAQSNMTLGSVISNINQGAPVALDQLDANAEVEIVNVAELQGEGAENAAALEGAVQAKQEQLNQLHADIEGNAQLTQELEAEGFEVADVVAVSAEAEGTVILYVWDQA